MSIRPICKNCKHCVIVHNKRAVPKKAWFESKAPDAGKCNSVYCKKLESFLVPDGRFKKEVFKTITEGNSLPMACFEK